MHRWINTILRFWTSQTQTSTYWLEPWSCSSGSWRNPSSLPISSRKPWMPLVSTNTTNKLSNLVSITWLKSFPHKTFVEGNWCITMLGTFVLLLYHPLVFMSLKVIYLKYLFSLLFHYHHGAISQGGICSPPQMACIGCAPFPFASNP